jgi:hypothetical protein
MCIILVKNLSIVSTYKDDLNKTTSKLRKALNESGEFDKDTVDTLLVLLSKVWLASVEAEAEEAKNVQMNF